MEKKNIRRVGRAVTIAITSGLSLFAAQIANAIPQVGMNGLTPAAAALAEYIVNTYPVQSIGGVRRDALPDHPTGHAIDIMIPNWNTAAGIALGNAINADLNANKGKWGIKYILWRCNPQHMNHVHVTVY